MAFPANTIVCDLVTKTNWGYRRSRFYFEADTPPTDLASMQDLSNAVFSKVSTALKPMMTTQAQMLRVESRFYGGGGSDLEGNSTAAMVQGDIAALVSGSDEDDGSVPDTLPDEVSLIIQKRTGQLGRQKRGRWFFTGLSEKIQNEGVLTAAGKVGAKAAADAFSDDITDDGTHFGSFTGPLHARHYDRKDNTLIPIIKCYAIATMGSRIDRRKSLTLERV